MNYGIKLQSCERYILWCNDQWYETTDARFSAFTSLKEAVAAIKKLVEHYVYHVTLVWDEGQLDFNFGKECYTPETAPQTIEAPVNAVADGDFSLF